MEMNKNVRSYESLNKIWKSECHMKTHNYPPPFVLDCKPHDVAVNCTRDTSTWTEPYATSRG